jgi:hypothetical protein
MKRISTPPLQVGRVDIATPPMWEPEQLSEMGKSSVTSKAQQGRQHEI